MPQAFKHREILRLINAARAAGLDPVAVEVDLKERRIKVIGGKSEARRTGAEELGGSA
jgi:hypothetical protein